MATSQILGQSLKVLKNPADYYEKDSSIIYNFADDPFPGDVIPSSVLNFSKDDAQVSFFSLLKKIFKGKLDVVITTLSPDDESGVALVDHTKTRILFNADGTFSIYNPDFEKLAEGETADVSFTYISENGKDNSNLVVREATMQVTGTNEGPIIVEHEDITIAEDSVMNGQVVATDIDSDDDSDSLTYNLIANDIPAGFTFNVDGSYSLDASMPDYQYLAVGQTVEYSFSWQAMDSHGALSGIDNVTVTITGTNDTPVVAVSDLTAALTELVTPAGSIRDTGTIAFSDADLNDAHSVASVTASAGALGTLTASVTNDTTGIGTGGVISWEYNVAADAVEYLAQDQTRVESFTLTLDDGNSGTVDRTVEVTITGTNDKPVVAVNDLTATLTELATPLGSISDTGTIDFSDVDLNDAHSIASITASVDALGTLAANVTSDTTGLGTGGVISWEYNVAADAVEYLAQDQTRVEIFTLTLDDGNGGTIDRTVEVTMTGTNDAPVIVAHEDRTVAEDSVINGQVMATDIDSNDDSDSLTYLLVGSDIPAGFTFNANGSYSLDASMPDYQYLAEGQTVDHSFSWQAKDSHGVVSTVDNVTVTITGTNDAPVVSAALTSDTDEDAAPYTINLLDGAADVDNGSILHADNIAEASGKGGWSVAGNIVTVNPDFYDELNNGEFETLEFNYQVFDEHGASANQSLTVNIEGVTDAPSLSVTTSAGNRVNEVRLTITSQPANTERVALTFVNLPVGAVVLDHLLNDVTTGISDYIGTQIFTVVLPEYQDTNLDLSVTVTGIRDNGEIIGQNVQEVGLSYDFSLSTEQVSFSSLDQNMWGNFNGQIGWHEYIPFIGGVSQVWDANQQAWNDTGTDYWRSGEFNLIDIDLDSNEILDTVAQIAEGILNVAKDVFYATANAVDQVALGIFNAAKVVYEISQDTFYATANLVDEAALLIFNTAKDVYNTAKDVYYAAAEAVNQTALATFRAAETAYDFAKDVYNAADSAFNFVAQGIFNAAEATFQWLEGAYSSAYNAYLTAHQAMLDSQWGTLFGVPLYNPIKVAADAATWIAQGVAWTALEVGRPVYNLAKDAYEWAKDIWDGAVYAFDVVAQGAFDLAKDAYDWANQVFNDAVAETFQLAEGLYDDAVAVYEAIKQGVYDAAEVVFQVAEDAYVIAEGVYDVVKQGIYDAAEVVFQVAVNVYEGAIEAARVVDFGAEVQVQAELYAEVGLQVDFELDLGSVDTAIDYQLTSQTQYNQTTDMLAITPMMTNMTDGESVAFCTISPNATFYAAILYDVGADIYFFADGHLSVATLDIFDLSPDSDGICLETTISTNSWNDLMATIPEAFRPDFTDDIGAGQLVLIDFDSTEGGPWEVPFIETLTEDILSIELNLPTIKTEGQAADFDLSYYQEGPFVNLDISEITDAFLNLVNAKLDFSDELKELYDLPSLDDSANLGDAIALMAAGLMAQIWDMLDGQSEGAPIFILDATDETSTSLLHINLYPDDLSTIDNETASFGFYAAYGESDHIVKVNIDIDAAVAVIVNKVAEAVLAAVTAGASAGATTAIPDFNPLNIEFGIEQVLEMVAVPEDVVEEITSYIDLGFTFEAADLDAYAAADFSQEFTLSIDDMIYQLTMEDGSIHNFNANGEGDLVVNDASQYDINNDGAVGYNLEIVPEAMFSNDTEVGLSLGYVLDFLKGDFAAGVKLPLGELLGLEGDSWPDIELPMIDIAMGPLLRIQGDLDVLDVDVFEARFDLDVGSDLVELEPVGITDSTMFIA